MFNLNGKKFKVGLAIAAFLGSTFSVLAEVEPLIMPAPLEPVPVEQIKAPVEQVIKIMFLKIVSLFQSQKLKQLNLA